MLQPPQSEASAARRYARAAEQLPTYEQLPGKQLPHPWKRYQAAERILLQADDPLGQLLAAIYGLTRQRWRAPSNARSTAHDRLVPLLDVHTSALCADLLRPVPSGGRLYPCEIYVGVGAGQSRPAGIFYYDGAHHALVTLRAGTHHAALQACLSDGDGVPALTLLLSCCFWKNAWRYGEFSYRLHSLDIGVVLGQSLAITAQHGYRSRVHYHFADLDVAALLGLDAWRESVYAIVTLHQQDTAGSLDQTEDALRTLMPVPLAQPEPITHWPLLAELHQAALLSTSDHSRRELPVVPALKPPAQTIFPLPEVSAPNLAHGVSRRHSAMCSFRAQPLTLEQFAQLLAAAAPGYANDLDGAADTLQHTLLYCVVNAVATVPPGVYRYCPVRQQLELIVAANAGLALQQTLRSPTHNMSAISLCIFPVACYETGFQSYGDRWYRVQNMEGGLVLQRLALAAAALGLGSHMSLAYHVAYANHILQLPADYTTLAQMMIGYERVAGQSYEQALLAAVAKEKDHESA